MQFAPSLQVEPTLKLSHDLTFTPPRHLSPQCPRTRFENRMPPFGGDIEERPEYERPLGDPRMGQNERPLAGPGEARMPSPPMLNQPLVVENVDIERARAPGAAAAAPGSGLDPLQEPKQRLPRQRRVDQGDGVDVRGLARATDGRSLIERGDSLDRGARVGDFTQSPSDRVGRSSPRSGTIGTQTYQCLAMCRQLRSAFVISMLFGQTSNMGLF